MKEFIVLGVVCIGLAIAVELVYVALRMLVEWYFSKLYREEEPADEVTVIHVVPTEKEVDTFNDPFDLGVKVDRLRIGDEP